MLEKSIVLNKETGVKYLKFRATHIMALNDFTERELFVRKFVEAVCKYAIAKDEELTSEQYDRLEEMCNIDAYVISLSDSDLYDDLNMWRGYGGNGNGICLEFDFSKIPVFYSSKTSNIFQTENVYLPKQCQYFQPEEINIDSGLVETVYEILKCKNAETDSNAIKQANYITQIAEYSTIYKHIAYKSEKEWRFVVHSLSEPFFSNNGNLIKPHIDFFIPLSAIVSITIGPCINGSNSIKNLEQFIKIKLGPDFAIRYSQIPYRG